MALPLMLASCYFLLRIGPTLKHPLASLPHYFIGPFYRFLEGFWIYTQASPSWSGRRDFLWVPTLALLNPLPQPQDDSLRVFHLPRLAPRRFRVLYEHAVKVVRDSDARFHYEWGIWCWIERLHSVLRNIQAYMGR